MNIHKSKIFSSGWNVAYRPKTGILNDRNTPFEVLKNTYRSWAADPFLIEHNGEVYIFVELYDYIDGRGSIGYHRVGDKNGRWVPVISESYHLSYPQIFRKDGQIYIMPEANASKTLYCYRAVEFPNRWEKLDPIRSGVRYADTSLFQWNGRELALTYQIGNEDYKLKLLDLDNPEKDRAIDISNIELRRPAGAMDNNNHIRPAQNCREDYGKGLIFYQYSLDSNMNYQEVRVAELGPEQLRLSRRLYLDGLHTYNMSENYEVIDIKTRFFNIISIVMRLKWKIRHLRH